MKTWKPNWEESQKNYINWWNGKGLVISMWEHLKKEGAPWEEVQAPAPPIDLNQRWFDPQWRAADIHHYLANSSFMADIPPVANTQLGPGSLAAILGAELEAGEDTIWIRHKEGTEFNLCLDESSEKTPSFTVSPATEFNLCLDESNKYWRLHVDLLKACKANSEGRYYVGIPDLMEGLDVLAGLKGNTEVLMDMMLDPDGLLEKLQKLNDLYFEVYNRLYDIVNVNGESAFCYFSIWGPGKVSKLQSDISIMISEEDFRKFEVPFLRKQCQNIDFTLYHLDGVGARRHLDALLEIDELNAIQWTPGYGEPQGGDPRWHNLYRKILAKGKSVMPCWVTVEELQPLLDNVGNQGLNILMDFKTEKDIEAALKIADRYR
jgi:hypothetical protein